MIEVLKIMVIIDIAFINQPKKAPEITSQR